MTARRLCVELHDVAPATWPECRRLLDLIDRAHAGPATLLVVPDFHGRGRVDRDPAFVRALAARAAAGDEIALHGYSHADHGPRARSPLEWFRRRVRTLSEGEFAALDAKTAGERLDAGLAMLRGAGFDARGFVPPAWLAGRGARAALRARAGAFAYVALRSSLIDAAGARSVPSSTLSYAAFTATRRLLSRPVLDALARRAASAPLVRLALHPVDARFDAVRAHWSALIRGLRRTHAPATVLKAWQDAAPGASPREVASARAA